MRLRLFLAGALGATGLLAIPDLLAGWLCGGVAIAAAAWFLRDDHLLRRDIDAITIRLGRIGEAGTIPPGTSRILIGLDAAIDRLIRRVADRTRSVEQRQRLDATLIDLLPDPIVVLDAGRAVLRANRATGTSFGRDLPAVLRNPGLRAAIDRVRGGETPVLVEISLAAPVAREVLATVISLDTAPGGPGFVAIVLSDRTRERAIERMRADFVANVSHELRTPLTTLVGFTDTLRGPAADDPPARARFLAIMAEQGQRMTRLIDDLLSLSRIELVEHLPPSDPVDLAELCQHVLTFYAARSGSITTAFTPGLPAVPADRDQLIQVVQNLLDNALKYGRDGGMVRLSLRPDEQRGGVILSVADEGPGIPPEHLPRLTERFYRVDRARSRSAGGTGLGLAIVKHIVNRHRGQLRIESAVDVGTTVSVWLPAMAAERAPTA